MRILLGTVPSTIASLTSITNFNVGSNCLIGNQMFSSSAPLCVYVCIGTIPTAIGSLTNLANLYLNSNSLIGCCCVVVVVGCYLYYYEYDYCNYLFFKISISGTL